MLPFSEVMPVVTVIFVVAVLMVCTVTDIAWHRIPNLVLLPALLVALVLQFALAGFSGVVSAISGLFVGIAFLLPLYVLGGMGAGDAKLLGVVGAFLGPLATLTAGVFTLIAGAIFGLLYIAARRVMPILVSHLQRLLHAEAYRSALYPVEATQAASQPNCFAYAPAISAGTLIAMWQQNLFSTLILS
jgi:prepilin peptidase CpaA